MDIDKILENSANAFEAVARATQKNGLGIESHSLVMASSVNAGLAIELYAKCLSQVAVGRYEHTHNLTDVLAQLPETLRSNLRAAFASAVTNTAKDEIRRVCIESGATIDTGFDSVVANWSKVFRRGRYWFEASGNTSQPALHWFFFDELVSIMKKEIEQQRSPQNA